MAESCLNRHVAKIRFKLYHWYDFTQPFAIVSVVIVGSKYKEPMKKLFIPGLIGFATALLLAGCACDFRFGGGSKTTSNADATNSTTNNSQHPTVGQETVEPTIGQQLIDLKKAKDAGAITEAEYGAEKAKLLNGK
jgi:hypothetical protein